MKDVEVFLSRQAIDTLSLKRGQQKLLLIDFIDHLELEPDFKGDYHEEDETQRVIQVKIIKNCAVYFWFDSPVNEIKVTRIQPAGS